MSGVMIHCRRSYYKEHWIVVVPEEDLVYHGSTNIKEWTGQSMSSFLRSADDRGQLAVIAVDASVGVPQRRLDVTGISQLVTNKEYRPHTPKIIICRTICRYTKRWPTLASLIYAVTHWSVPEVAQSQLLRMRNNWMRTSRVNPEVGTWRLFGTAVQSKEQQESTNRADSVLGPILFSIYTSPITSIASQFRINQHQYADDTQLFISVSPTTLTSSICWLVCHLSGIVYSKRSCLESGQNWGHLSWDPK